MGKLKIEVWENEYGWLSAIIDIVEQNEVFVQEKPSNLAIKAFTTAYNEFLRLQYNYFSIQ